MQDFNDIQKRLAAPFDVADVDWKTTKYYESKGLAVPYIDSRAIQNRLDSVVGPENWKPRYIPWHLYTPKPGKYDKEEDMKPVASQICALAIFCEARGEWIEKQDGAENTDYETIKGGISDSFKRAAVMWGIGRYLYDFEAIWVVLDDKKQIKDDAKKRLRDFYVDRLQKMGIASVKARPEPAQTDIYRIGEVSPVAMPGNRIAFWVQLVSQDQTLLTAFYQGAKQGLARGGSLGNVKLTSQNSAGGPYYEMQDFDFAA